MLIYVFPPHYQLVYINFDISSFSLISYGRILKKICMDFNEDMYGFPGGE